MKSTRTGAFDMKEYLRLDTVFQNIAMKLKGKHRISKLIKTVSFAWFVFTIVSTVWSLIPKTEDMPEVDAEAFLKAQVEEAEKKLSEEQAEFESESEVACDTVTA